jgi:hypothetical protein
LTDHELYETAYKALGPDGLSFAIENISNATTFKLVTGVDYFDPYRPSAPGRGYGAEFRTIFLADNPLTASGEVIPNIPVPQESILGQYLISGDVINFGKIGDSRFQQLWRSRSEADRHGFSQGFTSWLRANNLIPKNVIGGSWRSVGCEAVGRTGTCYGIHVTGEKYIQFMTTYAPGGWPVEGESL